jgi:hypothetical protein
VPNDGISLRALSSLSRFERRLPHSPPKHTPNSPSGPTSARLTLASDRGRKLSFPRNSGVTQRPGDNREPPAIGALPVAFSWSGGHKTALSNTEGMDQAKREAIYLSTDVREAALNRHLGGCRCPARASPFSRRGDRQRSRARGDAVASEPGSPRDAHREAIVRHSGSRTGSRHAPPRTIACATSQASARSPRPVCRTYAFTIGSVPRGAFASRRFRVARSAMAGRARFPPRERSAPRMAVDEIVGFDEVLVPWSWWDCEDEASVVIERGDKIPQQSRSDGVKGHE